MIPHRYSRYLFGLILSGLMSLLVSGITVLREAGVSPSFLGDWVSSWLVGWAVAFPTVLVVAPIAQRLVSLLTAPAE